MEGQPECFVSGPLAKVLRVSKFAGVAPLRYTKQGNGWRVSQSRNCSLVGHVVIMLIYLTAICAIANAIQFGPKGGRNVWIVVVALSIMVAATGVHGAHRRMRRLITCFNQVEKIRSELNTYRWPALWTRKQAALFLLWVVASVAIYVTDFVLLMFFRTHASLFSWVNVLSVMKLAWDWTIIASKAQFMLVALHVQSCFQAVNDCLRSLRTDIDQNGFLEPSPYKAKNAFKRAGNRVQFGKSRKSELEVVKPRSAHEVVRRASSAYASACDVVRTLDHAHGSVLILLLGLFFANLVSKTYSLILCIIDPNRYMSHIAFIVYELVQGSLCIYHVASLVMIIEPCHLTHVEMETTRELVNRLSWHTHSVYDPLAVELQQFSRQLTLNRVSYRPLYVTTMTRGLVLTILGSITTYLVILVDIK